jgi:hypothetical protein
MTLGGQVRQRSVRSYPSTVRNRYLSQWSNHARIALGNLHIWEIRDLLSSQ